LTTPGKKKSACPKGDECPVCFGLGFYEDGSTTKVGETVVGTPVTRPCKYALAQEISYLLDQAHPGLSEAKKVSSSELFGREDDDLYITGSMAAFLSHLKFVAIRMGRTRGVKVVSDSELVTAWLGSVSLGGGEILDPDAAAVSSKKLTLVDLIEPPDLLVIRLGVKSARNVAMCEVFEEALRHRSHRNKATWVYDPDWYADSFGSENLKIRADHRCYSIRVEEYMAPWPHVKLDAGGPRLQVEMYTGKEEGSETAASGEDTPATSITNFIPTLSGAHNSANTGARRFERETREPKQKKTPYKGSRGDS